MTLIDQIADTFNLHNLGAMGVLVKYGEFTPTAARTLIVGHYPDLTGPEKSTLLTWLSKINTVALPAGEMESDLWEATSMLLEQEWISRADAQAIFER